MGSTETVEAPETDAPVAEAPETKAESTTPEKPVDKGESLLSKKEEVKVEKVVPEKYDFKGPEGMEIDTKFIESATPILKELKLSQDEAGKLFGLMVEKTKADNARYQEIVDGWKTETIKELGADYQQKLAVTSKFIDKFGGKRADEVRQILNDSGLGSHPAIVALFIEAGKHFGNDSFPTGATKNQPTSEEAIARRMFPNTKY
jgi:hypothetical protein